MALSKADLEKIVEATRGAAGEAVSDASTALAKKTDRIEAAVNRLPEGINETAERLKDKAMTKGDKFQIFLMIAGGIVIVAILGGLFS